MFRSSVSNTCGTGSTSTAHMSSRTSSGWKGSFEAERSKSFAPAVNNTVDKLKKSPLSFFYLCASRDPKFWPADPKLYGEFGPLNAAVCLRICINKGSKMKLCSVCRADRAQSNGPTVRSLANFHIEVEQFLLFACGGLSILELESEFI